MHFRSLFGTQLDQILDQRPLNPVPVLNAWSWRNRAIGGANLYLLVAEEG